MKSIEKNKYNPKDIHSIKNKMMELSNLDPNIVEFFDVYVDESESVHMIIIDDFTIENKIDAVIIHGLTGSSMFFYKCFKELSKYMRIIALDLPGMGLSNRVPINHTKFSFEDAETFFVSRINMALNKIGVNKFHFITHSFGGYISCLYYRYHQERVLSLILLSPIGITSCYIEWISTPFEDLFQQVMYALKKPPSDGVKILPFSDRILDRLLEHKLKYIKNEEEISVFKDLANYIVKCPSTSEHLVYHFFNGSIQAYKPMIYFHECFENIKIDFIYGDHDWNPVDHAEEVIQYIFNIM